MFAGQNHFVKSSVSSCTRKRIGVIGCGPSGLVAMATALEYGHEVIGFERLDDIGGMWNFECIGSADTHGNISNQDERIYPCYSSLRTNTSAYHNMFSGLFPLNPDRHDYLTHEELCAYLKAYADKFNLLQRIKLKTEVLKLEKQTNKWIVHYENNNVESSEIFDFMMVCSGAYGFPRKPTIKQIETFQGIFIHSGQVRNGDILLKDKRVLIIGCGNSGADMMNIGLRNGAKKIYVSATKNPEKRSVWSRESYIKFTNGDVKPFDYCRNRYNTLTNPSDQMRMLQIGCTSLHKHMKDAELRIPQDVLCFADRKEVTAAKENNTLEFVGAVESIGFNIVHIRDGTELQDIDVIVYATGYERRFPFLTDIWPIDEQTKCELFNYTLSTDPALDGLAFSMIFSVAHPFFPVGEMQCRWIMDRIVPRNYDAHGCIFDDEERKHMNDVIAHKHMLREGSNMSFDKIDNAFVLLDHLAEEIGALPPDYKELIASGDEHKAELGVALAYGPQSVLQYRIKGPHADPSAAEKCIAIAKEVLGAHFDEFLVKAKAGVYPDISSYITKKNEIL